MRWIREYRIYLVELMEPLFPLGGDSLVDITYSPYMEGDGSTPRSSEARKRQDRIVRTFANDIQYRDHFGYIREQVDEQPLGLGDVSDRELAEYDRYGVSRNPYVAGRYRINHPKDSQEDQMDHQECAYKGCHEDATNFCESCENYVCDTHIASQDRNKECCKDCWSS